MSISFEPVTRENWEDVLKLKIRPEQQKFAPSAAESLAAAYIKPWDEALDLVSEGLSRYKGDEIAVISSAKCTNEENYVIQKLARAILGTNNLDHCARL